MRHYGLSPLARGTPKAPARHAVERRFIPAGAGNTRLVLILQRPANGLSPLARGTRTQLILNDVLSRFIPAGAGNTIGAVFQHLDMTVYPRWRGEHPTHNSSHVPPRGLSPLARGTRKVMAVHAIPARFIPAGAGNTAGLPAVDRRRTVYPRWRGEHGLAGLVQSWAQRFIPAGAGNTIELSVFFGAQKVYPRWRGEHYNIVVWNMLATGLSPLARGTR